MAAFPGPARAASTFFTSGVRRGLAKPGVPRPAQAPACRPASSAHCPCKERVWQLPGTGCGNCWPCTSLLGGVQGGVMRGGGGGSLLESQPPAWPGPLGYPCSAPTRTTLSLCPWGAEAYDRLWFGSPSCSRLSKCWWETAPSLSGRPLSSSAGSSGCLRECGGRGCEGAPVTTGTPALGAAANSLARLPP